MNGVTYHNLTIHQRINVKSWIRHDIPVVCVYHSALLYETGLPCQLADNIDTPCDRESLLFRRNWQCVRFPRVYKFLKRPRKD